MKCGPAILRKSLPPLKILRLIVISTDDLSEVMSGPLQYEEAARVCSQLKSGVSGVLID